MRSFYGRFLVITALLAVASLGTVVQAQQVTPVAQVLPELMSGTTGFLVQAGHGGSIPDPGEQSVCNAQCGDGSYVTCWGTSCSAHDSNCAINDRGYCTGTSTGQINCPSCQPVCNASLVCRDGTHLTCKSYNLDDCGSFVDCWVYCDGQQYDCPDAGSGRMICPK